MFLPVPGAVTLGQQTPRRGQLLPAAAALGFALAAAVWMIHRVLRDTAVDRADATMPGTAGLAENHVLMLGVAHLADGCIAGLVKLADFTGRQADLRITFVAGHQR